MHAGADTAPPPSSTTTPTVEAEVGAARAGAMLRDSTCPTATATGASGPERRAT